MSNKIASYYLTDIFIPKYRTEIISDLIRKIRYLQKTQKVESIVVRGISGITIGMLVAHKTKIPLAIVRKMENTHSFYLVEGIIKQNYIIIDDLIDSGNTIRTILKEMVRTPREDRAYKKHLEPPRCVGIFLYHWVAAADSENVRKLHRWYQKFKKNTMLEKIPIFRRNERLTKDFYI